MVSRNERKIIGGAQRVCTTFNNPCKNLKKNNLTYTGFPKRKKIVKWVKSMIIRQNEYFSPFLSHLETIRRRKN